MQHNDSTPLQDEVFETTASAGVPEHDDREVGGPWILEQPVGGSNVERFILMRATVPDSGVDGLDPEEFVAELIRKINANDCRGVSFTAEQVHPEYDGDNADDFVESNLGNFNINGFGATVSPERLAQIEQYGRRA